MGNLFFLSLTLPGILARERRANAPYSMTPAGMGLKDSSALDITCPIPTLEYGTVIAKDGTRTTFAESGPEEKFRRERLKLFKAIRADLGLSQSGMAAALHVSTKSIQGWEIGNPIPEPILILTQLLHDLPEVRKRLLAA